jgi:Pyruvate/2-oxoacid:ferredoxin oxidoreductase gamma subunit
VLVAMNELSLRKFAPQVAPHGLILYNSEKLPDDFDAPDANVICIPAASIADKLGSTKVTNIVLLGALLEETSCLSTDTAGAVIGEKIKKVALLDTNRKALEAGRQFIDQEVWVGAETQPDGFA